MDYYEPALSVFRNGQALRACAGAKYLFLVLIAAGAVSAQSYPGQYPPTGYPGSGYPQGGGGMGIPIPSRGQKQDTKANQPLPNYRGKLKQMDDKTITLTLDDDRDILFKRDGKTKFYRGGDEIKSPKFALGDQLSIEGPAYGQGYMLAVNVYWEKGAGPTTSAKSGERKDDSVADTWKDDPKAPPQKPTSGTASSPAGATSGSATGSLTAPPPAKPDPEDPGPPTLKRGAPSDVNRERADKLPEIPPTGPVGGPPPPPGSTPVTSARNDDDAPLAQRRVDDLVRRATDAAMDFTENLPNYVCKENVARYQSETHVPNWQAIDILTMDVIYENHKESYKNLTINGKATKKSLEESGGSWSTGEFGSLMMSLFVPGVAEFKYKKDSRSGGIMSKVYEFNVEHANSAWSIHVDNQSYSPAYRGSVWIDPATARVLRIEMQAYGFPADFPTDHVEQATDYEYTRLGDAKQYLLPVHSENLMCQRGTDNCSRNALDFRNYRKYASDSTIKFGGDGK